MDRRLPLAVVRGGWMMLFSNPLTDGDRVSSSVEPESRRVALRTCLLVPDLAIRVSVVTLGNDLVVLRPRVGLSGERGGSSTDSWDRTGVAVRTLSVDVEPGGSSAVGEARSPGVSGTFVDVSSSTARTDSPLALGWDFGTGGDDGIGDSSSRTGMPAGMERC